MVGAEDIHKVGELLLPGGCNPNVWVAGGALMGARAAAGETVQRHTWHKVEIASQNEGCVSRQAAELLLNEGAFSLRIPHRHVHAG